ncbi:MAG: phosphoribosylamine--glycine ligase [Gemmatimonadetes bacterium]|uniref:Phosphoribosylamine--glycine ligase n=1 Tax=Candidatus Kutchimonas denitrificans TaxID=3056748 RepID=A0AAE5C9L1_9BACT|nr:phosphoribosylamine--glycine ligase [Gemmatimonadota bacterium]NIR75601.1 phosphoribosylamine--glycine ligase [Candidatus Kutchimonas denitrificans]NIS01915.1 phosphoribosylamine--glycine ligase [Gemmatimonadota bacterium]NIT67696.1 phosphoribosylamine--glycine ligase [Gemmatimonadota bacterium]NIU53570.1 phosphoribosylamine--glycine ligase [Gemmatimonadota bacterium]
MRILVVGSGGREHALIWKLKQESPDAQIYAAPGNGGTKALAESVPLKPDEVDELADFADSRDIDLTVVGPEAPLVAGIVDAFEERGLKIFGPTARAAEIEGSKAFAKALMKKAGVPSAGHETFSEFDEAEKYIRKHGAPLVVKASGLAAGKGSIVCESVEEAVEAAQSMMVDEKFGDAGATIVVEDFLAGEELSLLYLTDGENAVPLVPSQDHKPIGEGDTGLNTGGMGAYAPVSIADDALVGVVTDEIILPTLAALRDDDRTFRGVLYAGLILVDGDPYVIEFNCRFGDPETQAVLPLMQEGLLDVFVGLAGGGDLDVDRFRFRGGAAVCTVLASKGYPGSYEKGKRITIPKGLEDDDELIVLHAGTRRDPEGKLVTSGGRVLGVVGLGADVTAAAARSREGAEAIKFPGKYFRRDIGYREIDREAAG